MNPLLIVGAGPAGLTLACELTRQGVPIRIVDQQAEPSGYSRALVLWPRTLELLEKTGLAHRFLESGAPLGGISVFENKSRRVAHISFSDLDSPYPMVLSLSQRVTERLLLDRLREQGAAVERGVEVVSIRPGPSSVEVDLRHPDGRLETAATLWLSACDGSNSTVRRLLGVRLEGETPAEEFAVADCQAEGLPFYDEVLAYTTGQGMATFIPMPGQIRLVIPRKGCGQDSPPPPSLEDLQQELRMRGLEHIHLSAPVWLSSLRVQEGQARKFRHGRVFLAGDAAHVFSPVGGQGLNSGMQDAYNLAWKLAYAWKGKIAAEPFLDSYGLEREPVGASVVGKTSRTRRVVSLTNPIAQVLRNKLLAWASSLEFVRHKVAEEAAELAVRYPNSPLNREVHPGHAAWLLGHGIHPGDRAPDGHLRREEKKTNLFERLSDSRFQLLVFSGVSPNGPTPQAVLCAQWVDRRLQELVAVHWIGTEAELLPNLPSAWVDEGGCLHRRYGAVEGTLYLIRPDGYVAFRSQPANRDDLAQYLTDLGIHEALRRLD